MNPKKSRSKNPASLLVERVSVKIVYHTLFIKASQERTPSGIRTGGLQRIFGRSVFPNLGEQQVVPPRPARMAATVNIYILTFSILLNFLPLPWSHSSFFYSLSRIWRNCQDEVLKAERLDRSQASPATCTMKPDQAPSRLNKPGPPPPFYLVRCL